MLILLCDNCQKEIQRPAKVSRLKEINYCEQCDADFEKLLNLDDDDDPIFSEYIKSRFEDDEG